MVLSEREKTEIQWYHENLNRIINPIKKVKKEETIKYIKTFHKSLFSKEFMFRFMRRFIKRDFRILDYGCGDGYNSVLLYKCLKPFKVFGFDLSPDLVKVAKKRVLINNLQDKIYISHDNGLSTKYKNEMFDVIFVNKVLHHLSINKGVEEIYRLVNENGIVIICEPINDSKLLAFIRKFVPIKKDVTPYERQLTTDELFSCFKKYFKNVTLHHFMILSRISRFIKNGYISKSLYCIDFALLKIFPFLKKFSAVVCVIAKNKKST